MTPEALDAIKERVVNAEAAKVRLDYLTRAIDRLSGEGGDDDVDGVLISFRPGTCLLEYRTATKTPSGFNNICWARREAGLAEELRLVLLNVLLERRNAAQAEFDNA